MSSHWYQFYMKNNAENKFHNLPTLATNLDFSVLLSCLPCSMLGLFLNTLYTWSTHTKYIYWSLLCLRPLAIYANSEKLLMSTNFTSTAVGVAKPRAHGQATTCIVIGVVKHLTKIRKGHNQHKQQTLNHANYEKTFTLCKVVIWLHIVSGKVK